MIPDKRFLQSLVLCAGIGAAAAWWKQAELLWYGLMGCFALLSLLDSIWVWRLKHPELSRDLPPTLPVDIWHDIGLTAHNPNKRQMLVTIFDHFPTSGNFQGLPLTLVLPSLQTAQIAYRFKPLKRGKAEFNKCDVLLHSPLRFWRRRAISNLHNSAKIYPNYAPVIEYALLATENRLSMMGILKRRRRGQGLDFHQLREYREGDSLKQIDWKATSRRGKLIAKEYQDERDQEILFVLDCGRRMMAQDGPLSHFDHAMNAMLLLSYVVLRQGDAVGISTFSGEPRWHSPVKGVPQLNGLIEGIYDMQPGTEAPDYSSAALNIMVRQRKRTLIILLTNLRDEDSQDLLSAVNLLQKRHLVMVVSLREKAVHDFFHQDIDDFEQALTLSATHEYLHKRQALLNILKSQGVNLLDVTPEQLPISLVNRYLDIKSGGRW